MQFRFSGFRVGVLFLAASLLLAAGASAQQGQDANPKSVSYDQSASVISADGKPIETTNTTVLILRGHVRRTEYQDGTINIEDARQSKYVSIHPKSKTFAKLTKQVVTEGRRHETDEGVAQGSVLSPLLANVYLHYVLDHWFERDVKPRLRGEAHLIRYADDFICAFEWEADARRFQDVLRKRLTRYSLELAEDKTKLLRFGRTAARESTRRGEGAPGTFDFLGFTHYCGKSRAGKFKLKRKTATKKLRAKFQALKDWFREQLAKPTGEVWQTLCAKLQGHFQYYNVNDNWRWVTKYREAARRMGLRWLRRRSQNSRVSWEAYYAYLRRYPLPNPGRIVDLIAMARDNAGAGGRQRLLFR